MRVQVIVITYLFLAVERTAAAAASNEATDFRRRLRPVSRVISLNQSSVDVCCRPVQCDARVLAEAPR